MTTPLADWTRLMNALRVRLPGALDPAIRYELFTTVDEFLARSEVWKEDIVFGVEAGEDLYEIEPEETTSKIVRLVRVQNSDETNVSATLTTSDGAWAIQLPFEPSAADDFTARVVLTVKDPVDSNDFPRIPTWVLERYREGFFDGVIGRMMSQPMKPYANERMSIYHLRRFRNVMAQAMKDAQHAHTRGANAWQYPRGWR